MVTSSSRLRCHGYGVESWRKCDDMAYDSTAVFANSENVAWWKLRETIRRRYYYIHREESESKRVREESERRDAMTTSRRITIAINNSCMLSRSSRRGGDWSWHACSKSGSEETLSGIKFLKRSVGTPDGRDWTTGVGLVCELHTNPPWFHVISPSR